MKKIVAIGGGENGRKMGKRPIYRNWDNGRKRIQTIESAV